MGDVIVKVRNEMLAADLEMIRIQIRRIRMEKKRGGEERQMVI